MQNFGNVIMDSLVNIFNQFVSGIPGLVTAIVIFIIGLIVAKFARNILKKVLEKIQIDKLGEKLNEIDMVSKANMEIKLSSVFSKIIYYVVVLFFAVVATDILGMPAVSSLVGDIFNFIPNLIVALIVLILGLLLAELIKNIVYTALKSLGVPSANLISTFLFYFLFINVIISALTQAKINTDFLSQNLTLLIGGGVLAFGIGYGMASKNSIANFLASFYTKDKIKVGDKITLEGITGTVENIDRSSLTIDTGSSKVIMPLNKATLSALEIHNS